MSYAPTAQEMKVYFSILKNCKVKPDVDWNVVASECGFKNGEVAKTRYGQIRKKLGDAFSDENGTSAPSPKAATTPKSVKASGVKKATGRVGGKAKTPRKTPVKKSEEDAENEDVALPLVAVKPEQDIKAEDSDMEDAQMLANAQNWGHHGISDSLFN